MSDFSQNTGRMQNMQVNQNQRQLNMEQLFQGLPYELTSSFNEGKKTLSFRFKSELVKAIITGDWAFFRNVIDEKNRTKQYFTLKEKDNFGMLVTKNCMFVGRIYPFGEGPEEIKGEGFEKRKNRIFKTKVDNDDELDLVIIQDCEPAYLNAMKVCSKILPRFLKDMQTFSPEDFTKKMTNTTISGIEILCFLAMKDKTLELQNQMKASGFTVEMVKKYRLRKDDPTLIASDIQKKAMELYINTANSYKLLTLFCMMNWSLESFRNLLPSSATMGTFNKIVNTGVYGMFGFALDGTINTIQSLTGYCKPLRNRDVIRFNYTLRGSMDMETTEQISVV